MTTVAYRAGVLASDSQATDNQVWSVQKLWEVADDSEVILVGICGDIFAAMAFIEWLKDREHARKPQIECEDFEAIVIASNGRVTLWNQSLVPFKPRGKFFAIGSGGAAAMGAMHAGKSAVEAVKIAKRIDPYTGGRVMSLRLKRH